MERYNGEHLGRNPHVVVLGSCKVGNFVVSTPVLRGLRARFPDAVIGFIGSEVTADFGQLYLAWIGAAVGMIPVLVQDLLQTLASVNAMGLCSLRSTRWF